MAVPAAGSSTSCGLNDAHAGAIATIAPTVLPTLGWLRKVAFVEVRAGKMLGSVFGAQRCEDNFRQCTAFFGAEILASTRVAAGENIRWSSARALDLPKELHAVPKQRNRIHRTADGNFVRFTFGRA